MSRVAQVRPASTCDSGMIFFILVSVFSRSAALLHFVSDLTHAIIYIYILVSAPHLSLLAL